MVMKSKYDTNSPIYEPAKFFSIIKTNPRKNDDPVMYIAYGSNKKDVHIIDETIVFTRNGGNIYELPLLPPAGNNFRVFAVKKNRDEQPVVFKIPRRNHPKYSTKEYLDEDMKIWDTVKNIVVTSEYLGTIWFEAENSFFGEDNTEGLRIDKFLWEGDDNLNYFKPKSKKDLIISITKIFEDILKLYTYSKIIINDPKLENWAYGIGHNKGKIPFIDLDTWGINRLSCNFDISKYGRDFLQMINNVNIKHMGQYPDIKEQLVKKTKDIISENILDKSERVSIIHGLK